MYVLFFALVLLLLHSTDCQHLVKGNSKVCVREDYYLLLQSRVDDIDRKLDDAVETLQRDIETLKIRFENARKSLIDIHTDSSLNDYLGGHGGLPFDDFENWKGNPISAIHLGCTNTFLFSIQIKYGDSWAKQHGLNHDCRGNFWRKSVERNITYTFDETEYITEIEAYSEKYLNSIRFRTNKRHLPRCGPEKGTSKTVNGTRLSYISGYSGCAVDGLQPHWLEM